MAVVQREHRNRSLRDGAIGLLINWRSFAFVFGWLLPRFIGYKETWETRGRR